MPAWQAPIANSASSIPVGHFARALFHALLNSNAPGPRVFAQVFGGLQLSGEAQDLQGDENIAAALKVAPAEEPQTCDPQPTTEMDVASRPAPS